MGSGSLCFISQLYRCSLHLSLGAIGALIAVVVVVVAAIGVFVVVAVAVVAVVLVVFVFVVAVVNGTASSIHPKLATPSKVLKFYNQRRSRLISSRDKDACFLSTPHQNASFPSLQFVRVSVHVSENKSVCEFECESVEESVGECKRMGV